MGRANRVSEAFTRFESLRGSHPRPIGTSSVALYGRCNALRTATVSVPVTRWV